METTIYGLGFRGQAIVLRVLLYRDCRVHFGVI